MPVIYIKIQTKGNFERINVKEDSNFENIRTQIENIIQSVALFKPTHESSK